MVSSSSRPASILDISRMSLRISSSASALFRATVVSRFCSGLSSVSSSALSMPMTPFMGVRSSWLSDGEELGLGGIGPLGRRLGVREVELALVLLGHVLERTGQEWKRSAVGAERIFCSAAHIGARFHPDARSDAASRTGANRRAVGR